MRAERLRPRAVDRRRALLSRAVAALMLAASACSGEDVLLGDGRGIGDAATDGDAAADASPPGPAFSAPTAIAGIAAPDAADDDPSLSADLTLLYFNSEREGGVGEEDIWVSTRESATAAWQPPEPALGLNTEVRETGIALAADALAIWWSSDRPDGEGGLDVYTATRVSREAAWSAPQRVAELSSAGDDLISAVTDGEQTALLARRDDDDDDYDLFVAQRPSRADAWGEPIAIAELNSDEEESDAFLVAGGRELLFSRDEDLQLVRRERRELAFGAPAALDALNSEDDDRDPWASEDFGYVVFSSDRSGSYLLYEAWR
jgi:hypothetical protein